MGSLPLPVTVAERNIVKPTYRLPKCGLRGYPGHRFELAQGPDAHGEHVRFSWHLFGEAIQPVATGIDFGTLAPDGRLRAITGFLEQPTPRGPRTRSA
jgi:hypothetical protein